MGKHCRELNENNFEIQSKTVTSSLMTHRHIERMSQSNYEILIFHGTT